MDITNLYAELQMNPLSLATYRKLSDYYKKIGKMNESEAFLEIIKKKSNAKDTNSDKK